ncbi:formylglycine-generating enzyme family protein [Antiquaquibacter oligotrophicus]
MPPGPVDRVDSSPIRATGSHRIEQSSLPGATFVMGDSSGDANPMDGELPRHPVVLDAFEIDITPVTNEQFAEFIEATGYITEAQALGASAVAEVLLRSHAPIPGAERSDPPWWVTVPGADWSHPIGPHSSLEGLHDHPVVHVSWNDANAYCQWAGRRLPTEGEWEYAARAGHSEWTYPWGNDGVEEGGWRANIWQGEFPTHNTGADGWVGTAPVKSFEPNDFGLWQMVGNVWEWCSDRFSPRYYSASVIQDPRGPERGSTRVLRGGSYLCHDSYCNRYRNSARSSNTPSSSMGNAGFRTVSLRAEP